MKRTQTAASVATLQGCQFMSICFVGSPVPLQNNDQNGLGRGAVRSTSRLFDLQHDECHISSSILCQNLLKRHSSTVAVLSGTDGSDPTVKPSHPYHQPIAQKCSEWMRPLLSNTITGDLRCELSGTIDKQWTPQANYANYGFK